MTKKIKFVMTPLLVLSMVMVYSLTTFAGIAPPEPNGITLSAGSSGSISVTLSDGETITGAEFIDNGYCKVKTDSATTCSFSGNTISVSIGSGEEATSTAADDPDGEDALWIQVTGSVGGMCGLHIYVTGGNSSSSKEKSDEKSKKKSVPFKPLTPKELQERDFNEAYSAGWSFLKMGEADAFMDFGKDGTQATLWQAGNKLLDFTLTDADGNLVKMSLLGIKTLPDGTKYLNISAYSKAGGLSLTGLTEDEKNILKETGISGIMIKDTIYNW